MERKPGFLQVFPNRIVPLLTAHTPDFLGLQQEKPGLWNDSDFDWGVIIGILDSGIHLELPSFKDGARLIPPPPVK